MPQIIVGDAKVKVSWAEYFAAILPKGTLIEWKEPDKIPASLFARGMKEGVGEVVGSMHYDGISLRVRSAGGREVSLIFGVKEWEPRIRRLRDRAKWPLEYVI